MARWLAHEVGWGTLATLDRESGEPVGGVVSHSDGARNAATGRLYFYLTEMDELTKNFMAHARCSYTISELQRGTPGCASLDQQDAACARATLLGGMQRLAEPEDVDAAREALFSRHPAMAHWPAGHNFQFYELAVSEVHLLDWYGGMKLVSGQEYYEAELPH